jgi:ATP-binding cassette, subfamily B, bacterial
MTIPFAQYRRALAYVAPYWRGLLAVMVLGLFSTAVGLVQPYISRLLIDDALLRRNLHALTVIAIAMVVVTVVGFAFNIASSYFYIRLSAETLFDMRLAVYRHLQQLSPRYFAQRKLGDIVSRINNDIGEVQRV